MSNQNYRPVAKATRYELVDIRVDKVICSSTVKSSVEAYMIVECTLPMCVLIIREIK